MSTVADKLAKKSTHRTSAKQVRLRLVIGGGLALIVTWAIGSLLGTTGVV